MKYVRNELSGEWWIDDSGSPMYADGDVGDMNHEMYAIDHVVRGILDDLDVNPRTDDFIGTLDQHEEAITQALGLPEGTPIVWYEGSHGRVENARVHPALLAALTGPAEQRLARVLAGWAVSDPRDFAVQFLGWYRVHGNNVQTWTLTAKDMTTIARGVGAVAEQDGADEDDLAREVFDIEVMKTRRFYRSVPFLVLEAARPAALREFA